MDPRPPVAPVLPTPPRRPSKPLALGLLIGLVVIVLAGAAAAHFGAPRASKTALIAPSPTPSPTPSANPTTAQTATPTATPSTNTPTPTSSPIATPRPTATPLTKTPTPTPAPTPTTVYKNGTYSATGHYSSPGGTEALGVTLTISGDTITASQVISGADNADSQYYQNLFINNYQPKVIGKALASLSLGKVSGSSLTPNGFNNALAQIRTQAQN